MWEYDCILLCLLSPYIKRKHFIIVYPIFRFVLDMASVYVGNVIASPTKMDLDILDHSATYALFVSIEWTFMIMIFPLKTCPTKCVEYKPCVMCQQWGFINLLVNINFIILVIASELDPTMNQNVPNALSRWYPLKNFRYWTFLTVKLGMSANLLIPYVLESLWWYFINKY